MASVVILERGMTAATFDAYLESEPRVAALAGMLSDDVDGDLLIDVIQAAECADGRALQQYFSEDATIGPAFSSEPKPLNYANAVSVSVER